MTLTYKITWSSCDIENMFFEFLVPENHIIDTKIIVLSLIVPEILRHIFLAAILDAILFCEPLQGVRDSHHKFYESLSSYEEIDTNRIFPSLKLPREMFLVWIATGLVSAEQKISACDWLVFITDDLTTKYLYRTLQCLVLPTYWLLLRPGGGWRQEEDDWKRISTVAGRGHCSVRSSVCVLVKD